MTYTFTAQQVEQAVKEEARRWLSHGSAIAEPDGFAEDVLHRLVLIRSAAKPLKRKPRARRITGKVGRAKVDLRIKNPEVKVIER